MKKNISTGCALLLSSLLLFSTSCVKEDEITNDTEYPEFIVFGTFFASSSFCGGGETCTELYKADATGLREDVLDEIPEGIAAYSGDYSRNLSVVSYQNVMDVFEASPIPEELLDMPNGNVGNLNEFGQNFYLEYKTKSGGYQYWVLGGAFDGSMPQVIQNYLNVLSNVTSFASQG